MASLSATEPRSTSRPLAGTSACILVTLAGLLAGRPGLAQTRPLRFEHLGVEAGLSSTWVRTVLRDSRGFLWIGTLDGLNRYDGNRFAHYRHEPGEPSTLASSEIWTLFEDSRERLWVGSVGGLHLYDRENDRFDLHVLAPGAQASASASVVRGIVEDRLGRLWVGTMHGLFCYDTDLRTATPFLHDPAASGSLGNSAVMALALDRRERLWVGTRSGLDRLDKGSERFVHVVSSFEPPEPGLSVSVESMWVDQQDALWFATWGAGLFRVDPKTEALRQFLPDPRRPQSIAGARVLRVTGDGRGHVYVGLENDGLDMLDVERDLFTHYRPDAEDPMALTSGSIWALHSDRQGILWIGTFNGGLNYVLPLGQQFGLLRARRGELSDPHVTSVIEDHGGDLWIGTDGGGLNRLDRRTGRMTYYRHQGASPRGLSSDAVLALVEDRRRDIWIGTWAGGLMRLDPRSGQIERFRPAREKAGALADACVWTIIEDSRGNLLLGGENAGVQVLDPGRRAFRPLAQSHPGAGVQGSVRVIVEDARGNLWLSRATDVDSRGYDAVQFVDRATRSVSEYRNDPAHPKDPTSLAPGMVYAIFPDSRGNVWIGTAGGLSCIPAGRRPMRRYTTADGLPVNVVTAILEDEAGHVWLSTTRGLAKIERAVELPDRPRVLLFDERDGLQGNEFKNGAVFRSRRGEMFFGGQRGLSFFFPGEVRQNLFVPPVVLTDLRIANRTAAIGAPDSPLRKSITETRAITLSPGQGVVTFEFAALNLNLPEKNQYAYKLDGFDPDWTRVGARPAATYTNLPSRRYVFRVRAANNDGLWNAEGVALQVYVAPRWHERRLVQALLLMLLGLAIAAAYRWRMRQHHAREQELTQHVDERTAELHRLNEELERRVASRTSELEAEKERLAVTLRSIGDGVIATDVEGRVVLMNRVAEELAGWSLDEAYGQPFGRVLPILDRDTRRPQSDPIEDVLSGGRIVSLPARSLLVRRDGRELLIADSAAPIRDRGSRIVGAVLVFRDVTEKSKVEEQLQNAQKLESLGILAGGIAHDFNNLLTGIFGYVDLARRAQSDPVRSQNSLTKALSVLDKARGLTTQLMTFSRAGQPETVPLEVSDLLRGSVSFALSGSSVSCDLRIAPDLWPCLGDERQIDQVIDNLLLNARQAMPMGGTVWVSARNVVVPGDVRLPVEPGRYVCLAIRDQGTGIPAELHMRVFEPFFTTKPAGTGLGLATSYSIVRKHGGHIDLESEVGHGSTFSVYLPASSQAARPAHAAEAEAPAGTGRVLLMDDEDYLREVASEMLENLGYAVEAVPDGETAVAAFVEARAQGRPFDLVILDLTVPGGLGGVETLSRLRAIEPEIQAVASSGYSGDSVMATPATHGFVGRLTKPYTSSEMGTLIAQVLHRRGR